MASSQHSQGDPGVSSLISMIKRQCLSHGDSDSSSILAWILNDEGRVVLRVRGERDYFIGRSEESDIAVIGKGVSRSHVRIKSSGTDLDSVEVAAELISTTAKMVVNGAIRVGPEHDRSEKKIVLQDGDSISVGCKTFTILYNDKEEGVQVDKRVKTAQIKSVSAKVASKVPDKEPVEVPATVPPEVPSKVSGPVHYFDHDDLGINSKTLALSKKLSKKHRRKPFTKVVPAQRRPMTVSAIGATAGLVPPIRHSSTGRLGDSNCRCQAELLSKFDLITPEEIRTGFRRDGSYALPKRQNVSREVRVTSPVDVPGSPRWLVPIASSSPTPSSSLVQQEAEWSGSALALPYTSGPTNSTNSGSSPQVPRRRTHQDTSGHLASGGGSSTKGDDDSDDRDIIIECEISL